MAEPEYRHEEVARVPRGYHVRTIRRGKHEIRVAYPPGRRVTGTGQLVSILHPLGENPHCHVRNIFLNPTTLERKRATRERAKRIREARLNPEKTVKGLHIKYSPVNQAYFLMWHGTVLRIFQTKAEAKAEMDYLLRQSEHNPRGKTIPEILRECDKLRGGLRRRHPSSNPNGDELEAAERLYEEFHGRAPREILEIQEQAVKRGDFTALGDLVELSIDAPNREHVRIHFKGDGVRLASSPEANQLWFISGNQDLSRNLGMFGIKDKEKDLLDLGIVRQIVYDAAKWQTDFTPQEWKHDLGEKSGVRPRLFYDQQDRQHPKMFLAGGTYKVKSPGIID